MVKGWSEGTAVLQEAIEKADDADGVKAGFLARLELRCEYWAVRMLRSAHVLKGAGKVDWKSFAAAAKAVLEGRALETLLIMEYVWEGANRAMLNEELLRGGE